MGWLCLHRRYAHIWAKISSQIFNAVSNALQYVIEQQVVHHIAHYLDDFIVWGPPGSTQCQQSLQSLQHTCGTLGVLLATHKTVGPASCKEFLGIVIDIQANELRLPQDKVARLWRLVQQWGSKESCP